MLGDDPPKEFGRSHQLCGKRPHRATCFVRRCSEAAWARGARIVAVARTDAQAELVRCLSFGDVIVVVVSIEELRRRLGSEFQWPDTMPYLPDPHHGTPAPDPRAPRFDTRGAPLQRPGGRAGRRRRGLRCLPADRSGSRPPFDDLPAAHQEMWENRHRGASYVQNHALPQAGLATLDELYAPCSAPPGQEQDG